MICRIWRGWTNTANADAYERVVRGEVIPGIEAKRIPGFRHIDLMRRRIAGEDRVEFTTLMWFDDLDSIRAFTGDDAEVAHVPAAAQAVLLDFDRRAAHCEVLDRRDQGISSAAFGAPLELPRSTALVVIDVQQGFDDGSRGLRNNPDAERNIARLVEAWREAGMPIHHVHHASTSERGSFRPGTVGHHPKVEAQPQAGEPVHVKTVNSGFIGTALEQGLRESGVSSLVIVGLTTNHCVSTTTRMAGNLGFDTYIVEDATAAFDQPDIRGGVRPASAVHSSALSDLSDEFAAVVATSQVLEAVSSRRSAPLRGRSRA